MLIAAQVSAPAKINVRSSQFVHLIVSSFIGPTLESFDFNFYTLLTPLIFNPLFFPQLTHKSVI